jgi:hypothetical protein
MSAGAAGLIVGSGPQASSQPGKRIDQYAPELESIISTSEPLQELASGTGGTLGKGLFGGRKAAIFSTVTFITTDA